MPEGNVTPRDRANQRISLLDKQLDKLPRDYTVFTKVRRKVKEFLSGEEVGLVTSSKRLSLVKKLKKLESSGAEKFRSQKNISEEQN
jgi:hypothetical protein